MTQANVLLDIDTQINTNGVQAITGVVANSVLRNMYLNTYSAEIGVSLLPTVLSPIITSTDDLKTILARIQLGASTGTNGVTSISGSLGLGGDLVQNTAIGGLFDLKFGNESATNPLQSFVVYTQSGTTIKDYDSVNAITSHLRVGNGNNDWTLSNATTSQSMGLALNQAYMNVQIASTVAALKFNSSGHAITGNGSNNYVVIQDNIGNKGLIYLSDYSANFTPESLVSKRYVDSTTVQSVTGPNVDNTDPVNPVVNPLGLIKIIDLNGEFFTDLASATAYIEQFITPGVITDKSFNDGIFFFTVPPLTLVSGSFLTDNITPSVTYASLIDRFGLLDLINCGDLFYMNAGHHIIGDGYFSYSAFNFFTGSVEMNSLFITASGGNFAESSTGKFIIKGRIGINETAQFGVNFFLNSTATIFANASKYTSNAGGIHGDLQRAIINGCNVFFDGIDKEDKRNKGVANGYVPLNSSAKIDSTYLPSYVDDVVEGYLLSNVFYEESSHITVIAASTGKIYIDLTAGQKNKEYRYSGSLYVQITNGLIATTDDVTEGSSNLYFTIARVLSTALTGINTALTGTITSSDTILTAFGRMQNQVTAILTALSNYATLTGTETLTNKRITQRVTTITSSATPTINTDDCDVVDITALATAITSMTTSLSGTPTNFQKLIIRIKDNGTARAIAWGASYASMGGALPTTTVLGKVTTVGLIYNTTTSIWGCVAVSQEV